MNETRYGMRVELPVSYEEAIEKATAALKTEGFGVLTTIDVKQTIKQKLDKDFRKYVILGACNPPIAYQALSAETDIGLLLPCNVVVYETDSGPKRRGSGGAAGDAGAGWKRRAGAARRRSRREAAPRDGRDRGIRSGVMSDYLWPLGFLAVWIVLQTWLLPRLGVPT